MRVWRTERANRLLRSPAPSAPVAVGRDRPRCRSRSVVMAMRSVGGCRLAAHSPTIPVNLGDIGTELKPQAPAIRGWEGALLLESAKVRLMGEYVVLGEARKIQARTTGKEAKSGFGKRAPSLTIEHDVKLFLDGMKIQDVGRGVGKLLLG